MSEVTRILSAIEQGDPHAAEQLLPLVYDELRKLAAQKLAQEKPGHTLEATALVHEAYLRLVVPPRGAGQPLVKSTGTAGGHFFAAAAEAMRRILVDQARRKRKPARGRRPPQGASNDAADRRPEPSAGRPGRQRGARTLRQGGPAQGRTRQASLLRRPDDRPGRGALGISSTTADRYWAYARAWLHAELKKGAADLGG